MPALSDDDAIILHWVGWVGEVEDEALIILSPTSRWADISDKINEEVKPGDIIGLFDESSGKVRFSGGAVNFMFLPSDYCEENKRLIGDWHPLNGRKILRSKKSPYYQAKQELNAYYSSPSPLP